MFSILQKDQRKKIESRTHELLAAHHEQIYRRTDKLFAVLMVIQWIGGIIAAILISPRTWEGVISRPHVHVYAAVFLGGLIAIMPIALVFLAPGRVITRHVIAFAQMLFSVLLIHLTGGRIETHFHVFGSLAFLAVYRDWRVLITASLVVAVDHFVRGIYWPQSVYGVLSGADWRWVEHVFWVVFEDLFLFVAIRQSLQEMRVIAERQAMLETAKQSVEKANSAKDAFLAHVSHEIRTPMTAILGYADLMSMEQQSEQQRQEAIGTIRRNGEHLLSILNDILDISKIEAGRLNIERVACAPAQLIAEVVSLMQGRAAQKNLPIDLRFLTPVPQTIQSDPTRLRQILINLLSNAIKFTQHGKIEVRVQMASQPQQISISVIDTGIGLSEEQLGRLFEPFVQLDNASSRKFGGTGLGLAICKRLAESLGGQIRVKSTPGKGSEFNVTIATGPLDGITMVQPIQDLLALNETPEPAASEHVKTGGTVLLVDDAPDNRRLLTRLLSEYGFAIDTASDGRDAVERITADPEKYDAVLMDMQMPELDGYAATRKLRQHGNRLPIIALTAHASDNDRQKCLDAGCDDYFSKPFDSDALAQAIRDHIADNVVA